MRPDKDEVNRKLNPETKAIIFENIFNNPYIPVEPTKKQLEFLLFYDSQEILIGGAGGGGKSVAQLMRALMFINMDNYNAILMRRSYQDLSQPGGLLDLSHKWLGSSDAKFNNIDKTWKFPNGNTLSFGYLASEKDKYSYQGAEYQYIGIDEASQIRMEDLTYMNSRLRKTVVNPAPLQICYSSNPGNISNDFLRDRYVDGREVYIPFGIDDNDHLNSVEYKEMLMKLSPEERAYMLAGDWNYVTGSELLITKDEALRSLVSSVDSNRIYTVIGVDFAADGNDHTAVTSVSYLSDKTIVVNDIARFKSSKIESPIKSFIKKCLSSYNVHEIVVELEPGSASAYSTKYWKKVLSEFIDMGIKYKGVKPYKSKFERARNMASALRNGKCFIFDCDNSQQLITEFTQIHPDKKEMKKIGSPDVLDSADMAYNHLWNKFIRVRSKISVGHNILGRR